MASVDKRTRNGRTTWSVRWRDSGGQKRKTFATQREAKAYAAAVETDMARGAYVDPRAGKVTLGEYAAQWLDSQTFDEATREPTDCAFGFTLRPTPGASSCRPCAPRRCRVGFGRCRASSRPATSA